MLAGQSRSVTRFVRCSTDEQQHESTVVPTAQLLELWLFWEYPLMISFIVGFALGAVAYAGYEYWQQIKGIK